MTEVQIHYGSSPSFGQRMDLTPPAAMFDVSHYAADDKSGTFDLHSLDSADTESTRPRKRQKCNHQCDLCRRVYKDRKSLLRHLRTDPQHGGTSYICEVCLQSFQRQDSLQKHLRKGRCNGPASIVSYSQDGSQSSQRASDNSSTPQSSSVAGASSSETQEQDGGARWLDTCVGTLLANHEDDIIAFLDHRNSGAEATQSSKATIGRGSHLTSEGHKLPSIPEETSYEAPLSDFDQIGDTFLAHMSTLLEDNPAWFEQNPERLDRLRRRAAATGRPGPLQRQMSCPLCRLPLGLIAADVLRHVRTHCELFIGAARCEECDIWFKHMQDYDAHMLSAKTKAHCGFAFKHTEPCTGHHPKVFTTTFYSDSDRFKFSYFLSDWEQAQLQAYIQTLAAIEGQVFEHDEAADRWSIGALTYRSYSTVSSMLSRLALGSEPDPGGHQPQLMVKLMRASAIKRRVLHSKTLPFKKLRTRQLDKLQAKLMDAVSRNDLAAVKGLLRNGAFRENWNYPYCLEHMAISYTEPSRFKDRLDAACSSDPLIAAAGLGYEEMTKMLLLNLPTPLQPYDVRFVATPLTVAARGVNVNIIDLLRENENYSAMRSLWAGLTAAEGALAMRVAEDSGNLDIIDLLREDGKDIDMYLA